jgi:peptidoglycan/xylan/chitin deacetylase (PgdA/CDA1 family)
MLYDPRLHSRVDLIKALLGNVLRFAPGFKVPTDDLIILSYHSTPRRFLHCFEKQVGFFRRKYRIISPRDLPAYASGTLVEVNRPNLLFTFDDGIENQFDASSILDKYGIKGIFFIVPAFAAEVYKRQADYYRKNIRPKVNSYINDKPEDFHAMSWKQIRQLYQSGHEIGSHSFSHTLDCKTANQQMRYREIVESKMRIADELGVTEGEIRSFCGPNDSSLAVGVEEAKLIMDHYDYFYSTFAGSNLGLRESFALKRANVECYWMMSTVKYQVCRFEWLRWKSRVIAFEDAVIKPAQLAIKKGTKQKLADLTSAEEYINI